MSSCKIRSGATGIVLIIGVSFLVTALAPPGSPQILVLSVCTSVNDVVFTRLLEEKLNEIAEVKVLVLYIAKDYSEGGVERSKLSDIWFLRSFHQVWIFNLLPVRSSGGRLSYGEISTLRRYVEEGHVLVAGYNTFVRSWSEELEELFGARMVRLAYSRNYTGHLDVVYGDSKCGYNDTLGAVMLNTTSASVLASFVEGHPAIVKNRCGDGVAVLVALNPVEEAVMGGNEEVYSLLAYALRGELENPPSPRPPPLHEVFLYNVRRTTANIFASIAIVVGAFAFTLWLAYEGLLPYSLTLLLIAPGAALTKKSVMSSERYWELLLVLARNPGITIRELSRISNVGERKLRYMLAVLEGAGAVSSIKLGERSRIFAIKGKEALAIVVRLSANERLRYVLETIAREPGILLTELSARSGIPLDNLLRLLRRLSLLGVLEMRRVLADYEVYPVLPLEQVLVLRRIHGG